MINKITKEQALSTIEKNIIKELPNKQLWGDLDISYEEYENLRDRMKHLLSYEDINISYICKKYPCSLVTFMVFLVCYKYNMNFWGLMSEQLDTPIYGSIESEIGACARKQFTKYGFDFSDVKDERRVNLEPIFYEAGLPPESSLHDLFYVLKYDDKSEFDPQLIIDDLIEMRGYQIRKPMLNFLRRFRDDRAIEYVVEVHDAMLCVDQSMSGASHYIGNYIEWKEQECSKESAIARKKKEFQTKPYLHFENGRRGLCLVLPRTIMKDEWIDDVQWDITGDDGFELHKKVIVFGDSGHRYVDSVIVSVAVSKSYTIRLIDNENFDDPVIIEWIIDGIQRDEVVFFNSNGRMINARYLMYPYEVMIIGKDASIIESNHTTITMQVYPSDSDNYSIVTIEPLGRDATLSFRSKSCNVVMSTRPQIKLSFEGNTLFGMPEESGWKIFTEAPEIFIDIEEGQSINGLELRIGPKKIFIDDYFEEGRARIPLKRNFRGMFHEFGTYSIRLYQDNHFMKQVEFSLVPQIKSSYNPNLSWPKGGSQRNKQIKFEKNPNWEMSFANCVVVNDESYYIVEYQPNVGVVTGVLRSLDEERSFSCNFELPVNPYEIEVHDNASSSEYEDRKLKKIGLSDIQITKYWVSLKCFGNYKDRQYRLKLRTVNGIEQVEKIALAQNSCGHFDLSVFKDTLSTCPLPAQIELWCDENEDFVSTVVSIADMIHLKVRPVYSHKNQYVRLNAEDKAQDLVIKRFGVSKRECHLMFADSKFGKSKSGIAVRGYKCEKPLDDGLYFIESSNVQHHFEFEEEENVAISNETDTMYVSARDRRTPILTISDWLDTLIKDILACGITKDISNMPSYEWIKKLKDLQGELTVEDYEKLIGLAYFVQSKCANIKKRSMVRCMRAISVDILNADSRLELIRMLLKMECPTSIFEICLREYNLYLFLTGSSDAKLLAEEIEPYSVELSMLLRMGIEDSIRNAVWRDKYRELIGREAIKELLSVPGIEDAAQITKAQKQFLREQTNCSVRINLTKEISGDMEPIQEMIKVTPKKIIFDITKKPDSGIYFDYIRYVDQYINWYSMTHDRNQEILSETKSEMIKAVQEGCADIMKYINDLKRTTELKNMIVQYESALQARYRGNPLNNMNACIPARYFYLQGMAALLAKLPEEYRKYGWAIRAGERFMVRAMSIAPRISRRDLIMASTYVYLKRKEEKLCR